MTTPADTTGDQPKGNELVVLRELALTTARSAGEMIMTRVGTRLDVATKSSRLDLVTEVDRAAEELITQQLLASRPHDGIVGEEGTGIAGTSGLEWSIDPIDGTTSFVYGLPGFAVSVAARHAGRVVAGAVVAPAIGVEFVAHMGGGAWRDGQRVRCSTITDLSLALVATGFSADDDRRRRQGAGIGALLPEIRDLRRMGSAALDLVSVGAAHLDAYFELGLNPWDFDAGVLFAQEAGAITEVRLDPSSGRYWVLASAPGIADQLLERLRTLNLAPF